MKGKFVILIAEDDPNDQLLIREAIRRDRVPTEMREVRDGEEAIAYLRGDGKYSDRGNYPFPELLMTDLKMPRMNGLEVLEWIRHHPDCANLPVVILSGSGLEKDVAEAYRRGARAYFVKPSEFNELENVVRLIAGHWAAAMPPVLPERCA
jgi:CheY-like chemotaxis protein